MKEKRKAYEEKLDAQFEEWNVQILLLKATADNAKANMKSKYYKNIEEVERKKEVAGTRLHELKNAGDDAWEELKTGAEKAWDEVKAASKFK
jgi:hypothetical protein